MYLCIFQNYISEISNIILKKIICYSAFSKCTIVYHLKEKWIAHLSTFPGIACLLLKIANN